MKEFTSGDIRNFAVVGHGAAGKTVLCEAMLSCAGEINRMGSIEAQNTISDYHHDEHERQISIHSSPLHLEWMDKKFNIIDTPGYLDFIGEAISSLAVVDMAVVLLHAANGVEVGAEQVWSYATKNNILRIVIPPSECVQLVYQLSNKFKYYLDWGGALMWMEAFELSEEMFESIRKKVVKHGGYVTMIKNSDYLPYVEDVFTINRGRYNISQNIKKSFDPKRILNPGKMYTGI